MNRHQRRKQRAVQADDGYEKCANDAFGIFEVYFVHYTQVADLIAQAMRGDARAEAFVYSIENWIRQRAVVRPVCINPNCNAEFVDAMPPMLVVVAPFAAVKGSVLISGVCEQCLKLDTEALQEIAIANLKKLWPSIGVLPEGSKQ